MDLREGTAIGDDPWKHGESTLDVNLIISKPCRQTAAREGELQVAARKACLFGGTADGMLASSAAPMRDPACLLSIVLVLNGCGFRLAGSERLPTVLAR